MRLLSKLQSAFHTKPTAFGCDISDHSIRIAFLREEGGLLTLASFAAEPLAEGIVSNGVIMDKERALLGLRTAVTAAKGQKLRTKFAVVSIPDAQAFLRIVQLPKMDDTEVGQAIKWEVEANIPLPLADVYYDWEISPASQGEDHLDVLVAAAPKTLIDSYFELFTKANLKPVAFDIDALSAVRSTVSADDRNETLLLIDVAFDRTTFIIFSGGLTRFTASVAVAGKDFSGEDSKALAKSLAIYAKQYIDFFQSHASHSHVAQTDIKKVLISGDDLHTSGLVSALSLEMNVLVSLANPWVNILRPPLREVPLLPYKDSLSYAVALGLALRAHKEFTDTK